MSALQNGRTDHWEFLAKNFANEDDAGAVRIAIEFDVQAAVAFQFLCIMLLAYPIGTNKKLILMV